MLTVSFAWLVATILLFCFERTRVIAAFALFGLLVVNPLLVIGLIFFVVIAAWLIAANGRDREMRRWLIDRYRRK